MPIRGIGDTAGTYRLLLLFSSTVLVPAVLLGALFLGAVGHERWTADALATREVEVQLPLLADRLAAYAAQQSSLDITNDQDRRILQRWAEARLTRAEDSPMTVVLEPVPPAHALSDETAQRAETPFPLLGWQLRALDARTLQPGAEARSTLASVLGMLALLGLLLFGGLVTVRAAAREIRMSQRQIELVGRVSHELRTPLTAIRMFVDTLQAGRLPQPQQAECLSLLGDETERLTKRIEEVLSWARMEAGARRYRRVPGAPTDVIEDAVAAFRSHHLLQAPPVFYGDATKHDPLDDAIVIDLPDTLPDILIDHDAVVEALLNLLQNAWRYSQTPRRIHLSAQVERWQVGIAVQDNGPGIPAHALRRVFEKFYRSEETTEAVSTQGTGLGLAIVRAIVRDHGGRVDVRSTLNRGSVFTLWIPTIHAPQARLTRASESTSVSVAAVRSGDTR